MIKSLKHHFDAIIGIEIFPIISFLIFFVFFVALIVYVMRQDKGFISKMSTIPLEDEQPEKQFKL